MSRQGRYTEDIPLHRGSVGAMGVALGSQMPETFRPYHYRGTGEDQFPETAPAPKPKPKPKSRKERKPKPPRKRKPRYRPPYREYTRWPEPEPPAPEPEQPVQPSHKPLRPAPGWKPLSLDDLLDEIGEDD